MKHFYHRASDKVTRCPPTNTNKLKLYRNNKHSRLVNTLLHCVINYISIYINVSTNNRNVKVMHTCLSRYIFFYFIILVSRQT